MKGLDFILIIILMTALNIISMWNDDKNSSEVVIEVQNYQSTIDSLINKNQRLNDGFITLYNDWSEVQVENDKLTRDNKYLKRITR